jgi:hypothetical protein
MEMSGSLFAPDTLPSGETARDNHSTGGSVGSTAVMDAKEKGNSRPCWKSNPHFSVIEPISTEISQFPGIYTHDCLF